MDDSDKRDGVVSTVMDPSRAPRRLREGLVADETGIFLRIEEGQDEGRTLTLSSGGVYIIGRDGADVALDDVKVSRKHAELGLYGEGAYVLRDLASTNGTWLNGRRISEKAKLKHWDLIQVGETRLRLSVIDDSIPV